MIQNTDNNTQCIIEYILHITKYIICNSGYTCTIHNTHNSTQCIMHNTQFKVTKWDNSVKQRCSVDAHPQPKQSSYSMMANKVSWHNSDNY